MVHSFVKHPAQIRNPVPERVTHTLADIAGAIADDALPFAVGHAAPANLAMRHHQPCRACEPVIVQRHDGRDTPAFALVENRSRNQRVKIVDVNQVRLLGVEQVRKFAARGEAVNSTEKSAGLGEAAIRDTRAVAVELDDCVILSAEIARQILNRDFLAAQLAVGIMHDTNLQSRSRIARKVGTGRPLGFTCCRRRTGRPAPSCSKSRRRRRTGAA